jgi:hypothetical protein
MAPKYEFSSTQSSSAMRSCTGLSKVLFSKAFTIFLIILSCVAQKSYSQQEAGLVLAPQVTVLSGQNIRNGAQIEQTYILSGSKKIQNIVSLNLLENSSLYISEDFTATLSLKIEYGHNSFEENSLNQDLTVSFKKAEGQKYNAKNYIVFQGAEYVRVKVVNTLSPNAALSNGVNVWQLLSLQNEMRITRFDDLASDNNIPIFNSSTLSSDELVLSWTTPVSTGNNYVQLEWTWVDNNSLSLYENANGSDLNANLLFRNNSTRVDLPASRTSYNIPLIYEPGKIYYRVRAVNIKPSGSRIDAPWSDVSSIAYTGHENNLNWQATTSFAEEGKRKTVAQYFDGSLRGRQTVTKDNSTGTVLTSETFYDGQGRPAIQILPTPGIQNAIAYTKNLNRFNGQLPTEDPARFFDLESKSAVPAGRLNGTPTLDSSSGASQYYSSSNPETAIGLNKFIPQAEGYPYTVTRYTPDATGRVMAQNGLGSALSMGSTHETKYYYGSAAQEELDGLFGTEVGKASHYFKNMVKDANGQMSVSYLDMSGRTIATALTGESPAGLKPLLPDAAYVNQSGQEISRNLAGSGYNSIKENALDATSSILVPVATSYKLTYQLTPEALQLARCNNPLPMSFDCMYDLEISILDDSGETPTITKRFNNVDSLADTQVSTGVRVFRSEESHIPSNQIEFSVVLQPGSYTIRKTLKISEYSLAKYRATYLQTASCKTEQELIDSIYASMQQSSKCDTIQTVSSCQACKDSLGSYQSFRSRYLTNYDEGSYPSEIIIRAAFSADSAHCTLLCSDISHKLETIRGLMLSDMMPLTGQYAKEDAPSITNEMYGVYDVLYGLGTARPFYKFPRNADNTPGYYRNPENLIDLTIHSNTLNLSDLSHVDRFDLASAFTSSWAES